MGCVSKNLPLCYALEIYRIIIIKGAPKLDEFNIAFFSCPYCKSL